MDKDKKHFHGDVPPVICVSLDGNDEWSGLLPHWDGLDGPVRTPKAAVARAREIRRGVRFLPVPVAIHVHAGEHQLAESLIIEPEDSYLTLEGDGPGRTILSGGRRITGWQRATDAAAGDRFWFADLPAVKDGTWDFHQLFVNGAARPRARLPETGFFEHLSHYDNVWRGSNYGQFTPPPTLDERTTVVYAEGQLPPEFPLGNAEFTFYHSWDESKARAALHDPITRTLRLDPPCIYPPGSFGNRKYVVENLREGMLQPGQWHLDRDAGRVVYWPMPGEDVSACTVEAAILPFVVRVRGQDRLPVCSVTLRDFAAKLAVAELKSPGWGAGPFDGAVWLHNVEDARVANLHVFNTEGQGIKLNAARHSAVEDCEIHHTGANGIQLGGGAGNAIVNNYVHHTGTFYPSANGINVGGVKSSRIAHNEVHATSYCGITLGSGKEHAGNVVEYNRVYDVMNVLDDGGCIYTVGVGNIVRNNVFFNTHRWSIGLYIDEISHNYLCENNLVYDASFAPLQLHAGNNCAIRNNVFVFGPGTMINLPRSQGNVIERNIFYAPGLRIGYGNPAGASYEDNLYFTGSAKIGAPSALAFGLRQFSGWFPNEIGRFDTVQVRPDDGGREGAAPESRNLGALPVEAGPIDSWCEERCWAGALELPELVDEQGRPPAGLKTDVRVMRDGRSFYARVAVQHPPREPMTEQPPQWTRDHAELFLKPDPASDVALQLAVFRGAPKLAYRQLFTRDVTNDFEWEGDFRSDDTRWVAFFRVPLEAVARICGADKSAWGIFVGIAHCIPDPVTDRIRSGVEKGSVVADPLFVNPSGRDYRLRPDSPALKLGFIPFDPRKAGRLPKRP